MAASSRGSAQNLVNLPIRARRRAVVASLNAPARYDRLNPLSSTTASLTIICPAVATTTAASGR